VPATDNTQLYMFFGDEAGISTGEYYINYPLTPEHLINKTNKKDRQFIIARDLTSDDTRPAQIEITINRPFLRGTEKHISYESHVYSTNANTYTKYEGIAIFGDSSTDPITKIYFHLSSGNIKSGNFKLYGYR